MGLKQFANKGGLKRKREGVVFEGGVDTPMHTMSPTSACKSVDRGR